jgi:hypothetical protein
MTRPRGKLEQALLRVVVLQSGVVRDGRFFLAGGTGLSVRLGHRLSEDLDWFTSKEFDADELVNRLRSLREPPTEIAQQEANTVRAYYGTIETSFIRYTRVPARPDLVKIAGHEIPIADVELVAAMKAAAVFNRGTKRDFIDVHAITRVPGWSMERFINHATQSLPLSPEQLKQALTYFTDAEKQPMPRGCSIAWATVKRELLRDVRAWERERSRSPSPANDPPSSRDAELISRVTGKTKARKRAKAELIERVVGESPAPKSRIADRGRGSRDPGRQR